MRSAAGFHPDLLEERWGLRALSRPLDTRKSKGTGMEEVDGEMMGGTKRG